MHPGQIVSGVVLRLEPDRMIIDLRRGLQGMLSNEEQVPREHHQLGDGLRALVLEVGRESADGSRPSVTLSRARPGFVRGLLEAEVLEIAAGTVTITGLVREAGYGTKVCVRSMDMAVDCLTVCRGAGNARIDRIVEELRGERVDLIPWSEDVETFIASALTLAQPVQIELDHAGRRALLVVADDQLSPAIGRKGDNVRLASRLTGWDLDIMCRSELDSQLGNE